MASVTYYEDNCFCEIKYPPLSGCCENDVSQFLVGTVTSYSGCPIFQDQVITFYNHLENNEWPGLVTLFQACSGNSNQEYLTFSLRCYLEEWQLGWASAEVALEDTWTTADSVSCNPLLITVTIPATVDCCDSTGSITLAIIEG